MTILYRAVVYGKGVTMLSISGLPYPAAWRYCEGIFEDRLESLEVME